MIRLIDRIGDDTIGRLERAAWARLAEARALDAVGHRMAAIYLCGYVAELVLGSAYFRLLGFKAGDVIDKVNLDNYLKASRRYKQVSDSVHPLDGEARALVAERAASRPPGYDDDLAVAIVARVDSICNHWSYRLRYRSLEAGETATAEVLNAAGWLVEHYPEL